MQLASFALLASIRGFRLLASMSEYMSNPLADNAGDIEDDTVPDVFGKRYDT